MARSFINYANIIAGEIKIRPVGTAINGWLLCDGSAISRTAYSKLFQAIGTTHGSGDGVNTFNLPNFTGKFLRGLGGNSPSLGATQISLSKQHSHPVGTIGATSQAGGSHSHGWIIQDTSDVYHNESYLMCGTNAAAGGSSPGYSSMTLRGALEVNNTISGGLIVLISSGGGHSHSCSVAGSTANNTTGDTIETRPENMAVYHFIKY